MPDRSLDSLSAAFKPLACEWVARVTARGVAVMIIQTGRTVEEQAVNVANGVSATSASLHLPRSLRWQAGFLLTDADKADAMDIAPYDIYQLAGPDKVKWDSSHPSWGVIGEEAERVGLRWGGRWKVPFDPGHAELVLPWHAASLIVERARSWPTFRPA